MLKTLPLLALTLALATLAAAAEDPLSPQGLQQRIAQHRTAAVTLTVLGPDHKPLANTPITLRQTGHKFLFGCNAFMINRPGPAEIQDQYQKRFAAIFNYATLPFYWGGYEPTAGNPGTERLKAMARWCQENRIRAKGHPLAWHQVQPRWLVDKPVDEALKLQLDRIDREVAAFKGLIDTWDVVNEAVVMPRYSAEPGPIPQVCKKLGAPEFIRQCFAHVRAANPAATLLLNDYDTSPRYEALIRECLEAGVPIDVIGIQSHMHGGYWGAKRAWEVCERFARFKKPLHFTELTILSGPKKQGLDYRKRYDDWASTPEIEKEQAKAVEEFYTILFSHPSVEGITWWDFSDRGAWLGAPAGLVNKDMSPKPAYEILQKLIRQQWWTAEVKATTDAAGKVQFRGYLGQYALEAPGGQAAFQLDQPGEQALSAAVPAP